MRRIQQAFYQKRLRNERGELVTSRDEFRRMCLEVLTP